MAVVRSCRCQDPKYEDHLVPDDDTPMEPTSPLEPGIEISSSGDPVYSGLMQLVRDANARADQAEARVREANLKVERAYFKVDSHLAGFSEIFEAFNIPLPTIPDTSLMFVSPLVGGLVERYLPPD